MPEVGHVYEWVRSTEPPWTVRDWRGRRHFFDTEDDQLSFIDRDKRMLADATRAANRDVTQQITRFFESGDNEQTAGVESEAEQAAARIGGVGNRRSRRRASRAANRKKDLS